MSARPANGELRVTGLYVYPVKSCRAVVLDHLELGERGPRYDREWMVVDADSGRFVSQREHPELARVAPSLQNDVLRLEGPHADAIELSLDSCFSPGRRHARKRTVQVWRSSCESLDEGDSAGEWFSALVGAEVRLVRMAPDFVREANPDWAGPGHPVSFADGYPLLLTTTASLAAFNAELEVRGVTPVPMSRFRPNIVVDGGEPWQEDRWRTLRIGGVTVRITKPCVRCTVITIDQERGERPVPKQPLRALAELRHDRELGGATFGVNAVAGHGTLQRGDVVKTI